MKIKDNPKITGEKIEPKYEAFPIEPIIENHTTTHCYWAKLDIRNVQREDARVYKLTIESMMGHDENLKRLVVRDPAETKLYAAVGVAALALFLATVLVVACMLRSRKPEKYHSDVEDAAIAADAFYNAPGNLERQKMAQSAKTYARKTSAEGGLAIMYNYDEVMKHSRAMSPEADLLRRAPAVVLQAPTLV